MESTPRLYDPVVHVLTGCRKTLLLIPRRGAHRVQCAQPRVAPVAEDDTMRGDDSQQGAMFSYISPEERVPQAHPLRTIRMLVDAVLKELSPQFDRLYS